MTRRLQIAVLLAAAILVPAAAPADDHGDDWTTATPIPTDGTVVTGTSDAWKDEDWFSFNATAGHVYGITTFTGSDDFYPTWVAYGPDGVTVLDWGFSDDRSINTVTSGTYYLSVIAYGPGLPGAYELGLTDLGTPVDDHGNVPATATAIPVNGGAVGGNGDYAGDTDCLSFAGSAQQAYAVEIRALAPDSGYTSLFALLNSAERYGFHSYANSHAFNEDDQWQRMLWYVPAGGAGELYTTIFWYGEDNLGAYELAISTIDGVPEQSDDCGAAAAPIAADGTMYNGIIDPDTDEDWFRFDAEADCTYEVTTFERGGYAFLVWEVFGPDCTTLIASSEPDIPDIPDPVIIDDIDISGDIEGPAAVAEVEIGTFVIPSAGTYYFRVSSWPNYWGNTGYYEFSLDTDCTTFPDCNTNGVPDDLDIADGTSEDCDGDGVPDECEPDSDGDGVIDDCDECPLDPYKIVEGLCPCGVPNSDVDRDSDGTIDCRDGCPDDPNKVKPGFCGCGKPETDSDGDGTPDCVDGCPNDSGKTQPGFCGCNKPETDSDGDGTPDCIDNCAHDPAKTEPGLCGCGTADTDTDRDGIPDCKDNCPEVANPNQLDADGNGVGDACEAASQPEESQKTTGVGETELETEEEDTSAHPDLSSAEDQSESLSPALPLAGICPQTGLAMFAFVLFGLWWTRAETPRLR